MEAVPGRIDTGKEQELTIVNVNKNGKKMNKLQKKMGQIAQKVIDKAMGNGLMQEETEASGERYITPGMPEILCRAGAEGCVLLKNDNTLPLSPGKEVAVFGRCQLDWFYVGYGSGGDVNAPYKVNLADGLKAAGVKLNQTLLDTYISWTEDPNNEAYHGWWGHWPMSHPEMPVSPELAADAAVTSDTAIVVIGRAAGEDRENTLTEGSYYLTAEERNMLDSVCSAFKKVAVVLNTGNIIDLYFYSEIGREADISICASSCYLLDGIEWLPIEMGDEHISRLFKVQANGENVLISGDIILKGSKSKDGQPDYSLWTNWKEVTFSSMTVLEGWNLLSMEIISDYTNYLGYSCSFNLDYFSIDFTQ